MNTRFKQISEWVAKAGDEFMDNNKDIALTMGVIDKLLRKQGLKADAVSIEVPSNNIKLIVLIPDDESLPIEFVSGNRAGDIYSTLKESLDDLDEDKVKLILNAELSTPRR